MQPGRSPVASPTLAESIRLSIIESLASGLLQPGQPIDERGLSERFEVSRTPIREAILQLAAQGFVVMEPRSGASVPRLSIQLLRELLELLGELEGAAAKFAAKRMRPAEKKALEEALAACAEASARDDALAYRDANDHFHDLIYAACRNETLVDQIRALRTRCAAYTANRRAACSARRASTRPSPRRCCAAIRPRRRRRCWSTSRSAAATSRSS